MTTTASWRGSWQIGGRRTGGQHRAAGIPAADEQPTVCNADEIKVSWLEARTGIEPMYEDLQSSA
jgi:hypothetical protein